MIFGGATALMWMFRMVIKSIYDTYFRTDAAKNVLIYGIRTGGIGLAKSIRGEKPAQYKLRGFISHDPSLSAKQTHLLGEPIYEADDSLPQVLKDKGIYAVLVAPGRIEEFRDDTDLQDYILGSDVKILLAQNAVEWDQNEPGKGNGANLKPVSIEDLPTKENPYRFEPTITDRQNYLTAQWMVDESTRALCTMSLTLDLDISITSSFTASYPMNVFASYIGCEEDFIRTIIPSQDETIAYIFEYNPSEKTALYYAEPWNDETLEAFKASCTDQYYANTEEALVYVAQLMMGSFSEPAD